MENRIDFVSVSRLTRYALNEAARSCNSPSDEKRLMCCWLKENQEARREEKLVATRQFSDT